MYRTFLGILNLLVALICGICFLSMIPNHPGIAALDMIAMIINIASGVCALSDNSDFNTPL